MRHNLVPINARVLDLGGGDGRHSLPFKEELNADVTIVDVDAPLLIDNNLISIKQDIRDYEITGEYDLIIANNVLPFLDTKEEIKTIIDNVMEHLKEGGVFMFTLWGTRHSWSDKRITHTKKEVKKLLKGYNVYSKTEMEGQSLIMNGNKTFWHSYDLWIVK